MNIVLVHGFFGFRTFAGVQYFNGVQQAVEAKFAALPVHVFVAQLDPLARVVARASQLAQQIAGALREGTLDPVEPIHVIAHSMGGLDARYLISSGNFGKVADQIASLTTIGTPHCGSPVADLLTADGAFDKVSRTLFLAAGPLRGLIAGVNLDTGGIQDLTTRAASSFNEQNPDAGGVKYFSFAGNGRPSAAATSVMLVPTHALISQSDNSGNDGLVSVASATWGHFVESWPADHADEIGHNLDGGFAASPTAFDCVGKYCGIVAMLGTLGPAAPNLGAAAIAMPAG